MRPSGGSIRRGYSAGAIHPFHPRVPSAHEVGRRPSCPTRRGMRPAIDQPMRPSRCAATRFCAGIPARAADVEELLERFGGLDARHHQVHSSLDERHPRDRALASARITTDDGPPDRLADVDRNARTAFHDDRFVRDVDWHHSGWRAIASRVGRIGLDEDEVAPIADRIGERPREVAVAACNERRHAGKRHAGEVSLPRVMPTDRCAIPDIGGRQAEVHVVRDDGAAVGGQASGDRPAVAAAGIVVRRRKPCEQYVALSYVRMGVLGPRDRGRGAQIEHTRIRNARRGMHGADERRLPAARRSRDEVGERRRERRIDRGEA